ncbi:hypothetical protein [Budvicia aquatica]|uniref:Acid shock protein n=1 Tax=Budvicia aquatica TaxID=82979 RepID=A0A484ZMC0_9GAMM|nr:hypothetical protein [Budvicia aquatica]VFS48881.1 acid shock protein precursor [Budvicia aquatica]
MKRLLSLAVATMFVLSGSAFAAETATQPAKATTEQSSATLIRPVSKLSSIRNTVKLKKKLKTQQANLQLNKPLN